MDFRKTWYVDEYSLKRCIWCKRFASVCVIDSPCERREQYEERDLRGVTVVPDPPDFELPWA